MQNRPSACGAFPNSQGESARARLRRSIHPRGLRRSATTYVFSSSEAIRRWELRLSKVLRGGAQTKSDHAKTEEKFSDVWNPVLESRARPAPSLRARLKNGIPNVGEFFIC